jgi:hypothetical protein
MRALICAVILAWTAAHARAQGADAVALLPLDTDQRLELYGQPVAHAIAMALSEGKVDVVVVGPKMAVPEGAWLIVDGTIISKGDAVVLSLRVRNPVDGVTLESLSATAPALGNIDRATADVSAQLLPLLRDRLARMRAGNADHGHITEVRRLPSAGGKPPVLLVAISNAPPSAEPIRAPLVAAVAKWTKAHHRAQQEVESKDLIAWYAPKTVVADKASLALSFEILGLDVWPDPVFMARARVRVRIADADKVLFDRVITTDSVVGDKGKSIADLAVRVADEVLEILRPHMHRAVPSW